MKYTFLLVVMSLATVALGAQTAEEESPAGEMAPMEQKMQVRMQAMRQQMERIHATDDPEERQHLMREHMKSMRQGMQMMGGPVGQKSPGAACKESDVDCRMKHMDTQQQAMRQRMKMMHMMMEQMMQQMAEQQKSAEDG